MNIREGLNENRGVIRAAAGVIMIGVLAVGIRGACSAGGSAGASSATSKRFFSVDDGKNWFPEAASKIPPFEHQGKTAYGVKVYRCEHGKEFVSHLERYDETDKKRFEEVAAKNPGAVVDPMEFMRAAEVKAPGGKQWIRWSPQSQKQYQRTVEPRCPHGSTNAVPVLPE